MRINPYILEPNERIAAFRMGTIAKFAESGVPARDIDKIVKYAAGTGSPLLSPSGMSKAVVMVSVLTGVPLGIAAHVVDQHIRASRGKEKELQTQIGYYRNAAQQLGTGLAASA